MEIIWKNELQDFWGNSPGLNGSMKRIRKVNDTSFVGVRNYGNLISDSITASPLIGTQTVRLYNFTSKGKYNWIRDYYYYPIDSLKDPTYEINDIEIMSDGGFVLGGESKNKVSLNQGIPGQFAYLLRTNCLGFLSPPQAQFEYESEKNEVLFINNSMNAGSYTWCFGQGDSLRTGEEIDSVTHTYEYGGQYEVALIAHGCNGEADTVKLNINVAQGAYGNIGDNYFSLYPNPVQQGNLITIETGNVENGELHFFDAQGKRVKTVQLPDAKSIYFIDHDFSAATYVLQLSSEGKVLQRRKLVVQ
jgi:PKD repeat protein